MEDKCEQGDSYILDMYVCKWKWLRMMSKKKRGSCSGVSSGLNSQSQKSQHLQQWVSLYYFGFNFHYISLHHLIFYISLLIICSFLITSSILIPPSSSRASKERKGAVAPLKKTNILILIYFVWLTITNLIFSPKKKTITNLIWYFKNAN